MLLFLFFSTEVFFFVLFCFVVKAEVNFGSLAWDSLQTKTFCGKQVEEVT